MDTEDQPAQPTTFIPPAPAVADAGGDFVSRFLALLHRLPRFPTGFLQRLPQVHEVVAMGLTVEEGAQALDSLVAQGHVVRQPVVQHAVGAAGQDDAERWKLHVDPDNPPVPPGVPQNPPAPAVENPAT